MASPAATVLETLVELSEPEPKPTEPQPTKDVEYFVNKVNAGLSNLAKSTRELARDFLDAKLTLSKKDWKVFKTRTGVGKAFLSEMLSVAEAENGSLKGLADLGLLPKGVRTVYEMIDWPQEVLKDCVSKGYLELDGNGVPIVELTAAQAKSATKLFNSNKAGSASSAGAGKRKSNGTTPTPPADLERRRNEAEEEDRLDSAFKVHEGSCLAPSAENSNGQRTTTKTPAIPATRTDEETPATKAPAPIVCVEIPREMSDSPDMKAMVEEIRQVVSKYRGYSISFELSTF